MVRMREQRYPNRGNGWVLECPDCGWWKAPVWNRKDAIDGAGHHELICPGPTTQSPAPGHNRTEEPEMSVKRTLEALGANGQMVVIEPDELGSRLLIDGRIAGWYAMRVGTIDDILFDAIDKVGSLKWIAGTLPRSVVEAANNRFEAIFDAGGAEVEPCIHCPVLDDVCSECGGTGFVPVVYTGPKSFAVEMRCMGNYDFVGNGLRFATYEEAAAYGHNRWCAWTAAREYRVVPTVDEVTHRWTTDAEAING